MNSLVLPFSKGLADWLYAGNQIDFRHPDGAAALCAPDSLSWRVFSNPAVLFLGGVSAVVLELAEPRIRSGVWEHTDFRRNPVGRMRRTGLAALAMVYAPRAEAERLIARINRMHAAVAGTTPCGTPYRADQPELLTWVHATASFGFLEAWRRYAAPLGGADIDRFYAEALPVAGLFGAHGAPRTAEEFARLLEAMEPLFEASPIIKDYLRIVASAPILPTPLRPVQRLFLRAAVDLVPLHVLHRLGLGTVHRLRPGEAKLVRAAVRMAGRLALPGSPPVEASLRLGLAADQLYRGDSHD